MNGRPMTSRARAAFAAMVLVLSFAASVATGPLQEGSAAQLRGDYPTALRLLRPLADQGVARAQYRLGLMCYLGHGVPQNYAEALKWFRLAADQRDAFAQSYLGHMYYYGQGVPQDVVRAHMWFTLAAAGGDTEAAKRRDKIASYFTPAQIAEAQKLAREWQRKRPR